MSKQFAWSAPRRSDGPSTLTMHIDKHITTDSPSVDKTRTAEVTKTEDQGAIGVPVFFTAEELEAHGIDLDEFDRIGVRVEDGVIVFVPPTTVLQAD